MFSLFDGTIVLTDLDPLKYDPNSCTVFKGACVATLLGTLLGVHKKNSREVLFFRLTVLLVIFQHL